MRWRVSGPAQGLASPSLLWSTSSPSCQPEAHPRAKALQTGPCTPCSNLCILCCPRFNGCPSTPQTALGLQLEQEMLLPAWLATGCSNNFLDSVAASPSARTLWSALSVKAPSARAAPVQSPLPPLLHPGDAAAGAVRPQHSSQAQRVSQSQVTDTGPVTFP